MDTPNLGPEYNYFALDPAGDAASVHSTPDDPPWNLAAALGVWALSVVFVLVFPAFLLLPYIASLDAGALGGNVAEFATSDPTAVLLQIIAIVPAHIATLFVAWLVVTRMRRFSFRQTLGWRAGGMQWWHYVLILAAFFGLASVAGSYFPEQENDLLRILRSSRAAVFLIAFLATFSAPLIEEVVYRGVLYSAFQRVVGIPLAVIAVTLLFALVHVPQYYPSFSTIMLLTLLSLILTLVRVFTGNLLPCIILHFVFNAIQSTLLLMEPYLRRSVEEPNIAAMIVLTM